MPLFQLKNKEVLHIREATKADAANVIQYVKTVGDETDFLTFNGNEFNKTIQEEEDIIEDHQLAINKIFVLAELNGEIVGILNLQASPKNRLQHIGEFGVSVLKAHWNKGIGTHLVQYMIDWAKANSLIRKINLKVMSHNPSAIYVYQKLGFKNEGLLTRDLCIGDQFFDSYLMGLPIDPA